MRGDVQGVGFRFFVRRHAERLGVRGFVANQDDGSVLVEAEGSDDLLHALAALLREGPSASRVVDVSSEEMPLRGDKSFAISA